VFSNEVGVFCQYHKTVWEIKKMMRDLSFYINAKSNVIIIASPARAYLDKKCNRSRGRWSIG
jgi:hypothetical protein